MTKLIMVVLVAFFVVMTAFFMKKMQRQKRLFGWAQLGGAMTAIVAGACVILVFYPARELSQRVGQWMLFAVSAYLTAWGLYEMAEAVNRYWRIKRHSLFLINLKKDSRKELRKLRKQEEKEIQNLLKNSPKKPTKRHHFKQP